MFLLLLDKMFSKAISCTILLLCLGFASHNWFNNENLLFQVQLTGDIMLRRGTKRTLEDVGDDCETHLCILHFKDSNCEQFMLISKQKDPEERLQELVKIRDDRRSETVGSPYRMDDVCDQIPETLAHFHGYHRDCYQRFTANLNHLKCSQQALSQDRSEIWGSRWDTKDKIIFNADQFFLQ